MNAKTQEAGFSYIDVMIALVILIIGILALMAAITASVIQTKGQEKQVNAKQIATSTLESIMSCKETAAEVCGWDKIGNVCTSSGPNCVQQGIFLNGVQDVKSNPGSDQVVGTSDDSGAVVPGVRRQIVITNVCDPDRPSPSCNPPGLLGERIRRVEVTVTYYVGSIQRQERVATVLTNYAVE